MFLADLLNVTELSVKSPKTGQILHYYFSPVVGGRTIVKAPLKPKDNVEVGSEPNPNMILREIGIIDWAPPIKDKTLVYHPYDIAKGTVSEQGFLWLLKNLSSGKFTQACAKKTRLSIKNNRGQYTTYK